MARRVALSASDRRRVSLTHHEVAGGAGRAAGASHRGRGERRCCMNTRCGWGGVARTSLDRPQEPHYGDEVEGSSQV